METKGSSEGRKGDGKVAPPFFKFLDLTPILT